MKNYKEIIIILSVDAKDRLLSSVIALCKYEHVTCYMRSERAVLWFHWPLDIWSNPMVLWKYSEQKASCALGVELNGALTSSFSSVDLSPGKSSFIPPSPANCLILPPGFSLLKTRCQGSVTVKTGEAEAGFRLLYFIFSKH